MLAHGVGVEITTLRRIGSIYNYCQVSLAPDALVSGLATFGSFLAARWKASGIIRLRFCREIFS